MGIKHDTVGTQLTQAEWEAADSHHITDLIPEADDTYDLGSATYAWQDLFLEGDITMTDAGTIATSAGALTITSAAAATWSTSAGALTITSAAALNLNPAAGSAIVLDSTINVDAGVVTGATSITSTAFVGDITGDVTGNTDTFTASANNSTDETVYPVFVDGATGSQGAETDTGLTYNPNSGILTATQFTGALSGNATTATALATARAINGVNFDGSAAITIPTRVYGSTIKLLPNDFIPNEDGGTSKGVFLDDDGTTGLKPGIAAMELIAIVGIPEGYKATHVDVYDNSHNLVINVYEMNINASGQSSKGSGNANTTLDITDVNATATNYLAIEVVTTATSERVFGGSITIAVQ